MPITSINCIYCGAVNPAGTSRCVSCGAPIEIPVTPPVTVTTLNTPARNITPPYSSRPDTTPEQIKDTLDAAPINEQLKEGLLAAGTGIGALGVGTFFARTAAEAAAIAFSAFLVGYFAAMTSNFLLGLFGGLLIGLTVGLVVKRPLGVLFSAPLGTILGLAAGYFLRSSLPTLPIPALLGTAGGALVALLGGKANSTTGVVKWYGRFRPLLGMTGGFVFALIGYGIGALAH
jgi:hypothetical protein